MNELEREQDQPIGSGPDRARRRLTGAGLGAPVIMTLASRPVFGAQCLSNMMSGNLSNPGLESCSTGASPDAWSDPLGLVMNVPVRDAWALAGYEYGAYDGNGAQKNASNYSGGTLMSKFTSETRILAPGELSGDDVTMLQIIVDERRAGLARRLMAAYLNACLSGKIAGYQYILAPYQVVDLGSGAIPLPSGYTDLKGFLDSTFDPKWGSK